jgi:DNA-binding MarR family transcriptional regulator
MTPWFLRRVNQRYRDAITTRLLAAGYEDLPLRGYWALIALAGGADDASQLVKEMGVTKQAISKLIDIVVASGFVDRDTHPADRRRTVLRLTAKGRKAVAVIGRAVKATEQEFAAELGPASFDELSRMLEQLASTVTR